MATREKGVATAPCPECGKDLPLYEQADGSFTTDTCTKCHPKSRKEKAAAPAPGREVGTDALAEAQEEGVSR